MKILVTGANGFIGKNLISHLNENSSIDFIEFNRNDSDSELFKALRVVDAVIHLAAENRPILTKAFDEVNVGLTAKICDFLSVNKITVPLLFASSVQVDFDNPYGRSKLSAEKLIERLALDNSNPVCIFRLPGVFGKWCRPNYNSVVATFCYNKANDLDVNIHDANASVRLVYIDDVVAEFINLLSTPWEGVLRPIVEPNYSITVGELSKIIDDFKDCRTNLIIQKVGCGLIRALYATYISYLPVNKFIYDIPVHVDSRGSFVEMLKTTDSGQFSYFTAHPGVTRGGHYHHTKTEKFLVIKGEAKFRFRNLITDEVHEFNIVGFRPQIIETIPGWVHDITNVGSDELVVMLWANEIFDKLKPDTIQSK